MLSRKIQGSDSRRTKTQQLLGEGEIFLKYMRFPGFTRHCAWFIIHVPQEAENCHFLAPPVVVFQRGERSD